MQITNAALFSLPPEALRLEAATIETVHKLDFSKLKFH
jgi:hypothetical protein